MLTQEALYPWAISHLGLLVFWSLNQFTVGWPWEESRREALISLCSYHENSREPSDLWPLLHGPVCLRGSFSWPTYFSFLVPFLFGQPHLWSRMAGGEASPPLALITGLHDCNYRFFASQLPKWQSLSSNLNLFSHMESITEQNWEVNFPPNEICLLERKFLSSW